MNIRNLLDIIANNESNVNESADSSGNTEVMSLTQFLSDKGVEPEFDQEESVTEGSADSADMFTWMDTYLDNEDFNRHSDNVVHVAKLVGTSKDVKDATEIKQQHEKLGYMDDDLLDVRSEINRRLYPLAKQKFNDWAAANPDQLDKLEVKWEMSLGNTTKESIELDEAEKLKGVTSRPFSDDEASQYFDRTLGKDKTKADKYKMPYVHGSNLIPIVNDDGQKYNLPKLMASISDRPKKILKQNEKMQHSDGSVSAFYNVGMPALTGLAVDEDKGEFVIINTCPGAGQCKTFCYALKGGYVQWKAVSLNQSRMLNWLYNDPDGFMSKLDSEISALSTKGKKKNTKIVIRWHDAGDFFSPDYLKKAYALASSHPDVDFYAYTKIASVAQSDRPDNFKINFSMGAKRSEEKSIDFTTTKNSRVIPKEMFNDLIAKDGNKIVKDEKGRTQFKTKEDLDAFKQRVAAKYSVDPATILTYDQMMRTPVDTEKGKYNVIVMPGDGDDSANRLDVLNSFLLFH